MTPVRYHRIAIILHWVMALCILLMLASGLAMTTQDLLEKALRFSMYQWHKSLGVLLLWAVFLRLLIRLRFAPPPLPASMKPLEQKAAHAGHWALYALMLAMPLTGWMVVSSSVSGLPTLVFGWFTWPHLPGLAGSSEAHEFAEEAHEILAWVLMLAIAGHVAAVIKHYVVEKENLLPRMGIGKPKDHP
ncbi:MAG: cytochrome b [Proteobacteria bacterium]|nr:cytochrome b [Pseudomonadota bacterium]